MVPQPTSVHQRLPEQQALQVSPFRLTKGASPWFILIHLLLPPSPDGCTSESVLRRQDEPGVSLPEDWAVWLSSPRTWPLLWEGTETVLCDGSNMKEWFSVYYQCLVVVEKLCQLLVDWGFRHELIHNFPKFLPQFLVFPLNGILILLSSSAVLYLLKEKRSDDVWSQWRLIWVPFAQSEKPTLSNLGLKMDSLFQNNRVHIAFPIQMCRCLHSPKCSLWTPFLRYSVVLRMKSFQSRQHSRWSTRTLLLVSWLKQKLRVDGAS